MGNERRVFRPDWEWHWNPWRKLIEVIPDLDERLGFEETTILRGRRRIPVKEVLRRYVCRVCGADLEAFELMCNWWDVRCSENWVHEGIERSLVREGREAWAERERKATERIETAEEFFAAIYGEGK